jgi:hypothetical protein
VAKVVTAFTLAHSITLSLAALGVVSLPSRWIESAIALSVVLAALNNLMPVVASGRWLAAFAFGLLHGFGFAGALQDLGLPTSGLALSLAGFNIGVELGQLAIVAAFLPFAYCCAARRPTAACCSARDRRRSPRSLQSGWSSARSTCRCSRCSPPRAEAA